MPDGVGDQFTEDQQGRIDAGVTQADTPLGQRLLGGFRAMRTADGIVGSVRTCR